MELTSSVLIGIITTIDIVKSILDNSLEPNKKNSVQLDGKTSRQQLELVNGEVKKAEFVVGNVKRAKKAQELFDKSSTIFYARDEIDRVTVAFAWRRLVEYKLKVIAQQKKEVDANLDSIETLYHQMNEGLESIKESNKIDNKTKNEWEHNYMVVIDDLRKEIHLLKDAQHFLEFAERNNEKTHHMIEHYGVPIENPFIKLARHAGKLLDKAKKQLDKKLVERLAMAERISEEI